MVKTRKLGYTELELTEIGLGTWAQGGGGWKFAWGEQDDTDSIRTIHKALDLGINWIDTAAIYGLGHAEEVLGKALKGMKDKPVVATKCSRRWDSDGNIIKIQTRDSVRKEVEDSLKRLQLDIIDLYQVHWPEPEEQIEEGWEAMTGLLTEGKVRCIGVSNFNMAQLEKIAPIHRPVSLQPPYSMIAPDVENKLLPYCADHDMGIVSYSPMYKGLLTGKITRERIAAFPADDHRRDDPNFREPRISKHLALVDGLKVIADELEITLAQLAIAWVLRRPEVTSAIVGARRPGQIEDTARAAEVSLSEDSIARIDDLMGKN
jgi:aryl-alcohol dehydrogenase-like predicted oxidoreductase